MSNMWLEKDTEVVEYTAEQLLEEVKQMSEEAFAKMVLDAQLKQDQNEEITELERRLCSPRIESRAKEPRKLVGRSKTNVIYASKVRDTGDVQSERVFIRTWKSLVVTVHDRSLLTPLLPRIGEVASNKVSLDTFLKCPEFHQTVTLLIPGVTRKGKSELAKYMCHLLAFK